VSGWLLVTGGGLAIVVVCWLSIEIAEWKSRRRPPGAGALRRAQRDRARRPW
jgi:hypothetical protein